MKTFSKKLLITSLFCLCLVSIYGCTAKLDKKNFPTSYPVIENSDAVYIGSHPKTVLLEDSESFNFQREFEHEIGEKLYKIGIINKSQYWLKDLADFVEKEKYFQQDYTLELLHRYPTDKRFLLFSELDMCGFNMQTAPGSSNTALVGLLLTSTIIGAPLGIPMMIGGGLPRTEFSVSFKYRLYIYDRQLNAIAWKDNIDITESDSASGSINKNDRKDTLNYYKYLITDAFITSFQKGINILKHKS
jgi:hypothetical protein